MDDLRSADVDFLTIGQYLQPTRKTTPSNPSSLPMSSRATNASPIPKASCWSPPPLTRSSHHAGEDFARLKAARLAKAG